MSASFNARNSSFNLRNASFNVWNLTKNKKKKRRKKASDQMVKTSLPPPLRKPRTFFSLRNVGVKNYVCCGVKVCPNGVWV